MNKLFNAILDEIFEESSIDIEDTKKLINEYLNGEEEEFNIAVDNLIGKLKEARGEYGRGEHRFDLDLAYPSKKKVDLVISAYYTKDFIEMRKRIFSILNKIDYKIILNALITYFSGNSVEFYFIGAYHYKIDEKVYNSFQQVITAAKEIGITDITITRWIVNKFAYGCNIAYKVYFLENLNNNEILKEVYEVCNDREKLYMIKYMDEEDIDIEKREHVENYCLKNFTGYLAKKGLAYRQIEDFNEYIREERELCEVERPNLDVENYWKYNNYYNHCTEHDNMIRDIICLEKNSMIFNKILRYMFYIRNENLVEVIIGFGAKYSDYTVEEFIEKLENLDIDLVDRIVLYANKVGNDKGFNLCETEKSLIKTIKDNMELVIENLSQCNAGGKVYLIKVLNRSISENDVVCDKFIESILKILGDEAKTVRNEVLLVLQNRKFNKERLIPLLENKKALVREMAVRALKGNRNKKIKAILKERLEKDKSAKVKNAIMEVTNLKML